ncbi:MAG TPA: hypothetical protein VG815_03565 [Chloroflexota bacterium]|nr:hypothetical protein [Chloroflexota bacterium]
MFVAAASVALGCRPSSSAPTGAESTTEASASRIVFTVGRSVYTRNLFGGPWEPVPDRARHEGGNGGDDFGTPYYFWSPSGLTLELLSGFTASPNTVELHTPRGALLRPLTTARDPTINYGPFWSLSSDQLAFQAPLVWGPASSTNPHAVISGISLFGRVWRLWPPTAPVRDAPAFCQLSGVFAPGDPLLYLFAAETSYLTQYVQWSPRDQIIIYTACEKRWQLVDTRKGTVTPLPFRQGSRVALSRGGLVAGETSEGAIEVVRPDRGSRIVGRGYDPTWSPDGRWLYYIQRVRLRTLRFRMQSAPMIPDPPPFLVKWITVTSGVYDASVIRVRADGSDRQTITSQPAYGFAQLNVLSKSRGVVFTRLPPDWNLWRHRRLGLTLARVRQFGPTMDIEIARPGQAPRILIPHAHLPAVQP